MKNNVILAILFSFFLLCIINSACALKDPSDVYCESLGYKFEIVSTPEGEAGTCILPTGSVDSWKFLKGEVGTEFSYCKKMGYEIKTIEDWDKCIRLFSDKCAVCVLGDGSEIEVTELMGLSFEETTCGDGSCGIPENYNTCSEDCPSGSYDFYCDGVKDGKCDQDCIDKNTPEDDPDCPVCGDGKCDNDENCPGDCEKLNICGDDDCGIGENEENCCDDCGCKNNMLCVDNVCVSDSCGNNECGDDESYENCPEDCPSGVRDGYCDGMNDGLCDPDCLKENDIDCNSSNLFIYIIIGIVIVVLMVIILFMSRRGE